MNWMSVCWIIMAAACLTLATIHFSIWNKQRQDKGHLSFAVAGYSVALIGVFEMLLMHAGSPQQYALLVRWVHVPIALLVLALVAFARLHLHVGRPWLGHLAWMLRVLALVPNFTTGVNVNFLEIDSVMDVETWGGAHYMSPVGVSNPWMLLPQLSNYLLVIFFLDAAATAWRKSHDPSWAKATRICTSIGLFALLASLWNLAVLVAGIPYPVAILPAFTGVLLVMSYELGSDVLRAAQLAKELNASQATLRQSEQRIEDAVLAAGLGLWEWDLAANELWLSPRARELLGSEVSEFINRHQLREQIDPATFGMLEAAMAQMLASGGEYVSEFRMKRADLRERWLLARGQGEFDAQGTPVFLRGVLVDISDRKEATKQRDQLAHLSRVALLAELSGSLAHELNQPLTSILSNAQAAQRFMGRQPPDLVEVSESLANIVESDKRAGEIIRRIRAMLRKEPEEFKPIDLNEVVRDALHIMHSDLLSKDVEVKLELDVDLPSSEGDPVQLLQLLLNLIANASDAMQENEKDRTLVIRTRAGATDGVELSVSDRGSGIPASDLERIFSPFVTSKEHGMGLGLALCATIIEAHGGRLWATNNQGAGATLHFRLPAYVAKSPIQNIST